MDMTRELRLSANRGVHKLQPAAPIVEGRLQRVLSRPALCPNTALHEHTHEGRAGQALRPVSCDTPDVEANLFGGQGAGEACYDAVL